MKYSDQIAQWLKDLGYTHFFYVGGGNIMHLTESLSNHLIGVPVVHEVAAGIAAEYFNEISEGDKALALVTAGPGLTNIVTSVSGAWLESRELLVIGGQVKTSDLSSIDLRGRGIQEVDGVSLLKPTTKVSTRLDQAISSKGFYEMVSESWHPRKGPVFIEIPLDVQASNFQSEEICKKDHFSLPLASKAQLDQIVSLYNSSQRPVVLLGGGLDYDMSVSLRSVIQSKSLPVMTTYNGADRADDQINSFFGRPNTWGQRSSNIILQKSDLIIAIGTRLGLQQTGFNWREFGREAQVIQVDIDENELNKGHPLVDFKVVADANDFFSRFVGSELKEKNEWLKFARRITAAIPRIESVNKTGENFISPYDFIVSLEQLSKSSDLIVPCSSGSAFTLTMSLYRPKFGQRILTNKSLASMGYGLSGAIGACIAGKNQKRTILIEGDGGFAQNMQEVGTAEINNLNIKIFIFDDQGHASIRMTQRNYFNGKYLGCDRKSGLGLPDWEKVFDSWGVRALVVNKGFDKNQDFLDEFNSQGLSAFIVKIDPEQTYFPKISSRVTDSGSMESNPIDVMTPEIDLEGLL